MSRSPRPDRSARLAAAAGASATPAATAAPRNRRRQPRAPALHAPHCRRHSCASPCSPTCTATCPRSEAVLADVEAVGVDQIWCLGDLVGYGAEPDACVELARERCDVCLAGNHDLVVTGELDIADFSAERRRGRALDQDTIAHGVARVPARR